MGLPHVRREMQVRSVVMTVMSEGRVGRKDRPQCVHRGRGCFADPGKLGQVTLNLSLMPGRENGVHVGEIFVQGGPANTRVLGNTGHADGGQTFGRNEGGSSIHRGVPHGLTVGIDRVVPEFRHVNASIPQPCLAVDTIRFDTIHSVSINRDGRTRRCHMGRERSDGTPVMPGWVKGFVWAGTVIVLLLIVMLALGHGPWQHMGMTGMH